MNTLRFVACGKPDIDRFWSKVESGAGCWEWVGSRTGSGYGGFWLKGRTVVAHRVSWSLANQQDVPDGLVVRHKCDNKPCVRPSHLEIGTHADNVRDAMDRGRLATGDRNGSRLYPERLPRGTSAHLYMPDECRNGHPLTSRYVSASGERRCTECQRARAQRYKAKKSTQ